MPTYAYRCTACSHHFDVVQKFSDAPLTECPECSGPVRKVFQPVGIVFKGSGWYVTDSRKTDAPADPKAKTPETPASTEPAKAAESPAEPATTKAAAD